MTPAQQALAAALHKRPTLFEGPPPGSDTERMELENWHAAGMEADLATADWTVERAELREAARNLLVQATAIPSTTLIVAVSSYAIDDLRAALAAQPEEAK